MPRADLRRLTALGALAIGMMLGLLNSSPAAAQAIPTDGRVALFSNFSSRERTDGEKTDFTELIAMFSISGDQPGGIFEYAFDGRIATYPSAERDERVSRPAELLVREICSA